MLSMPCSDSFLVDHIHPQDDGLDLEPPRGGFMQNFHCSMLTKEIQEVKSTPILDFYKDKCVLITGGTGFLGKIVLEKLLRSCPEIGTIYLLMRPKKGHNVTNRLENLFNDPVFGLLNKESPKSFHKVTAVAGDISQPNLGLSEGDRNLLIKQVSVVFHSAATVRFNEKLKAAIQTNVTGTKSILDLCKQMDSLEAFVYVSTAYSNCPRRDIEESVYDSPVDPQKMIQCTDWLTEEQLEIVSKTVMGEWPNSYAFSKALAERLVDDCSSKFPVSIVRPSIVVSSWQEPVSGWIDNLNGPAGVTVGSAVGLIRTFNCCKDKVVDMVPVDMAGHAIIAAAWDGANNGKKTTVYNFVSSPQNPITWKSYTKHCEMTGHSNPPMKAIWYYCLILCSDKKIHNLLTLLLHTLPALLIDFVALLAGKKRRMLKLYSKIDTFADLASYFATRQWNFSNKNITQLVDKMSAEDRKIFRFDVKELSWPNYMKSYMLGLRFYLLKEDPSNIPAARRKNTLLHCLHRALQVGCLFLLYGLVSRVVSVLI